VPDKTGAKLTDAILMALDNHPALRNRLSDMLGIAEHMLPEEILSPPTESSFIEL
jgi:hypothetical protein